MTEFVMPGPASIAPGAYPGGVVIQVYAVPSGVLLQTSKAGVLASAAYIAGRDHDVAEMRKPSGTNGFCLVAFDGDTGRRFSADEWL